MREPRPPASGASRGVCGCRRPAHLTPRCWQQVRRLRDPSSSRAPPSQGPALPSDLRRRLTTPPHSLPARSHVHTVQRSALTSLIFLILPTREPSEGGACHQGLEGSSKHIGTWRKNSEPAREHCERRGPAGRGGGVSENDSANTGQGETVLCRLTPRGTTKMSTQYRFHNLSNAGQRGV